MVKQWAPTIVVTAATIAALVVYFQPSNLSAQSKAHTLTLESEQLAN